MDKKQKYLAYGCGFLIGTVFVMLFFGKKIQSKLQEKRIVAVTHHIVLGKDTRAKKPMPVQLTLVHKDYEVGENKYLRVLMLKDQTQDRLLRIEETIIREPRKREERLILRRQMLGDKVLVRLKEPAGNIQELNALFRSLQVSVENPGRCKGLYYLKLKGDAENPDRLKEIMQQLSLNKKIDAVIPVYVNEGR